MTYSSNSKDGTLKSFQNCSEADVPGYNDCPTFLLSNRAVSIRTNRGSNGVLDRYGNVKKRTSSQLPATHPIKDEVKDEEVKPPKSKQVLMERINELLNRPSKMPETEYTFYKTKVLNNISLHLDQETSLVLMTQFFEFIPHNVDKAKDILIKWMVSDVSIAGWCPALRKILVNAIF
ncbi:HER133Wp [Eremothecium sinecaudum]|uniref:HER133Wp n=1 Tax=Eremothecium sinecaudum TaxID=45286 RepID=A0A0X8HTV5_9SACH|nr:HER133Wp [Eremothecium sinecaudum]AMD21412.1 HER133Wp [Eremothecium sinecaudum]